MLESFLMNRDPFIKTKFKTFLDDKDCEKPPSFLERMAGDGAIRDTIQKICTNEIGFDDLAE
jgi:hypothetical protein